MQSTVFRPYRARLGAASFVLLHVAAPVLGAQSTANRVASPDTLIAIVGATVIDGNGGAPMADATIVIRGKRIAAVGPRASVQVPKGARVIDGAGKFVTPSPFGASSRRAWSAARSVRRVCPRSARTA